MSDEVQRELNAAVIPEKFSLKPAEEAAQGAALRMMEEGWGEQEEHRLPQAGNWPTAQSPLSSSFRGSVPLIREGANEFGVAFGSRGPQVDRDQHQNGLQRREKSVGVYWGLKF
jgi:hypothetical protein